MMRKLCCLLFSVQLLAQVARAQSGIESLASPDGALSILFKTVPARQAAPGGNPPFQAQPAPAGGQLFYEVSFRGKRLVDASALCLEFKDQDRLGGNVRIVDTARARVNRTYHLLAGKASTVRDSYTSLELKLEENSASRRQLIIEARAYDDGVAFRYVVPAQAAFHDFRLNKEGTEFRITKDPFIYALMLPNFQSMYESEFLRLSASSLSNQGGVKSTVLIGLPLLMEVPGVGWMAITEADLRDYAAMYLVNPSGSWAGHWFQSTLSPHADDPETAVTGSLPHHSAWRVLLVGSEPGRLVESNIVSSLNPESMLKDTSWIRPGKAAWDWWSGSLDRNANPAFTTDNMKYYVDFAAQSGFEYMLVDAGWSARDDILHMNGRVDIPALVQYAAAKNVKIWIWLHARAVEKQMDEAFPLYERWGVAGVKVDFVERDDQAGIDFYYRAAQKAAEHHLMIDFHGATKPTGMERTYPNVLGYEAVAGMEQSKAGSRDNPDHHLMLPFTRMLAGLMDYTPGGFNNVTKADFEARARAPMVMGTRAHQLAMYAVYEVPLQMVSDHPGAYAGEPGFEFIRSVPTAWDETRVLNGVPGEFITLARRRGGEWFLGSMTNWSARELDVPLTFLESGGFEAEVYSDAPDAERFPKHLSITRNRVDRSTVLKVQLAPGGGYAARLRPLKQ